MLETPESNTSHDSPPSTESHTLRQPPNAVANHSFDSDGLALAKRVLKYFGDGFIDPELDGDIELREMARKIVFDVSSFPCSEVSAITGNRGSHTLRPAANLSLANHSPEPWYLFSTEEREVVFDVGYIDADRVMIIAQICCVVGRPLTAEDFANAELLRSAARMLRVLRQLFATFLVPMEFRDVPEQVEAVKAASELLHDLQRAGVF